MLILLKNKIAGKKKIKIWPWDLWTLVDQMQGILQPALELTEVQSATWN